VLCCFTFTSVYYQSKRLIYLLLLPRQDNALIRRLDI
jgi:hypothetical protein